MIFQHEFDTKEEVLIFFKKLWEPFLNSENKINENIFSGKKVIYYEYNIKKEGTFEKITFKKRYIGNSIDKKIMLENGNCVCYKGAKIFIYNPIINCEEWVLISKLLEDNWYVNQKIFKSCYYKTKEYKEKLKSTNIKNNGEDYNVKRVIKASATMLKKYGVPYFLCRGKSYEEKIFPIMLEKYGTTVPIKNSEIKKKISSTIKKRYGVNWFLERGEHYKTIEDIMLEKFGVINSFLCEEIREKAIKTKLSSSEWLNAREYFKNKKIQKKLINKQSKKSGAYSNFEFHVINFILENFDFKQPFFYDTHADLNQFLVKGQFITKKFYKVDFYDKELNLVIEILGDYWHANPIIFKGTDEVKFRACTVLAKDIWEKDIKRKQEIINSLNCDYIEIWESEFKENKNLILNKIKHVLESKKHKEN